MGPSRRLRNQNYKLEVPGVFRKEKARQKSSRRSRDRRHHPKESKKTVGKGKLEGKHPALN